MASEGKANVSLILELKNRMSSGITRAKEHLNQNVQEIKNKLSDFKKSHIDAFKAMKDEIPGFSRAMELLGNPYVLVTAGLVALGAAGYGITKFSSDWEKGMAKVNVTAQLSKDQLGSLSDKILDIGSKNAVPLAEVPEAFNRIISAGLSVNQSLEALEPTLRAAKAGFTDTSIVAAAGVSVMKSSGEDINKVYDVLFATLNKGNAEFEDIANYLPKLVPDARSLGLSLGEVAGAFAYMTAQGQTAEQSTTLLQNTFKAFGKGEIRKNLEAIGVKVFDGGKVRPFVDIIDDLKNSLTGLTDEQRIKKLEALGLDGEASRGLAAMVQNAGELRTTIDFTTNSAGQLNKAYDNAKTSTDDWVLAMNGLKALFKPVGDGILFAFGAIGTFINGIIGFVSEFKTELLVGITAATLAWVAFNASMITAGIVTAALTVKQWALNIAMNANPIGIIIIAIAALAAFITLIVKKYDEWGAAATIVLGPIGAIVNIVMSLQKHWDEISKAFKDGGIWEGIKKIGAVLLDALVYPIQQLLNMLSKIPGLGKLASGAEWIKEMRAKVLGIDVSKDVAPKKDGDDDNSGGDNPLGTPPIPPLPPKPPKDPSKDITANATQGKNITINIDSFVKGGINTAHTNLQNMDETQLEQWMSNMFMRVIRNAEMGF